MQFFKKHPLFAYWGAWFLAGSYNLLRDIFSAPFSLLLMYNLAFFTVWGVLGLLALPLMRRYPLRLTLSSWLFHLVLGSVMAQTDVTLGYVLFFLMRGELAKHTFAQTFMIAFESCFHLGLLTYLGFLALVQGLDTQKLAKARAVQLEQQKGAFVRAQLQSLKTQLQPHFLFNTLHAISSLMHYDVDTADRMLNRLSELLRLSLQEGSSTMVNLKQEMAFTEAYVEIEKIRFEQRLNVTWAIADDLQDVAIPAFIMQPLVENAIKYGIAPRAAGGQVIIRAYAQDADLLLEVENDGAEEGNQKKGFGIGLNNTRARLETLYGIEPRFELLRSAMGTLARIRLPLAPLAALPREELLAA